LRDNTFCIVSLGCAKNTVDSDSMAQLLAQAGYEAVADPRRAHFLIVNTCGFIDMAKEESLNTLSKLAAGKKNGQVLIAAGCMVQRYGAEVTNQVSSIDGILGTRHWMDIVKVVDGLRSGRSCANLPQAATNSNGLLHASVQGKSAYLKIADGCRRPCAFCAIPLIKGPPVSLPVNAAITEARALQEMGVREIILIAQDTTDYGYDLGLKNGLAHLLKEMTAAAPKVDWFRIMYAYPGYVTDELINVMATNKQVVPYLDIPLQHAHRQTLRRMRRPTDTNQVRQTLEKMRQAISGIALRTTFIVGYPGETEEEFQTLLDFIGEIRFDRVGAFKFSFEPGTPAEPLADPVPAEVKEERYRRLMEKQQPISLERNRTFIGHKLDVLVEGAGQGVSMGRSYRDAPEIDGLVMIKGEIPVGKLVPVRITGAGAYDLSGVVENEKLQAACQKESHSGG
jgi:ribosomal protein S12 methylthiotransferase